MKLNEFKKVLSGHPEAQLRFELPNGDFVPAHAHVTEVARIDKRFVDCGGTFRQDSFCRLQTWFSDDTDHRLMAGKLLKILEKAKPFLESDEIEVDVEHELDFISQFPIESAQASQDEIVVRLAKRHTACLAEDRCMPKAKDTVAFNPFTFNPREKQNSAGCCGE
ncbi:MAG TPA: DUF6428 family protein [Verrucomicrobiae bacterium]|nr:DUF6428 family protein [Verrucomicrobiae bacterium]